MKTAFTNKSGLTAYALSCGHVQLAKGIAGNMVIRVSLTRNSHEFYVMAVDSASGHRMDHFTTDSLGQARAKYVALVNEFFGSAVKRAKADPKYRVVRIRENDEYSYEVRLLESPGEYEVLGESYCKQAAWVMAANHLDGFL